VQVSLLPKKLPKITGYSLSAFWKPAAEISGDFYGVYKLPGHRWGLVIADVCGKGASAALFMAMTYSLIREQVEKEPSPAALLASVNHSLYLQFPELNFVTCVYAVLDPIKNSLAYAIAGHNPPILRKADGQLSQLMRGSMTLGLIPDTQYEEHTVSLEPGDSLAIFTDGVTDAINAHEDFYELRRLQAAVRSAAGKSAPFLSYLKKDLSTWVGPTHQYDDITLLVLTRD
jgi:sigma-B regulation protein RsbU (phosphoserine phosphatase)